MTEHKTTSGKLAGSQPRQKSVPPIDWADIHRRMGIAQDGVERSIVPELAEKKAVLKARAKSLAKEPKENARAEDRLEVVEFLLAYERYGIESSYVREIFPLKDLTSLPSTPPFVLGLVNVRGQIVSVIDIKRFVDIPDKGLTDLNKVIILHNDQMEIGLIADAIVGINFIPLSEIQPSLPTLTGIRAEYLKGVTKERLVILDAKRLLLDKKIIVHEEVEP